MSELSSNDLRDYLISRSSGASTTTTSKTERMGSHQSKAYLSSGQVINVENFVLHIPTFVSGLLSLAAFALVVLILYCGCRKFLRSSHAQRLVGRHDARRTTLANESTTITWPIPSPPQTHPLPNFPPPVVAHWTPPVSSAPAYSKVDPERVPTTMDGKTAPQERATAVPTDSAAVYPRWG